MKKTRLIALLSALSLALTSCVIHTRESAPPPEGSIGVYFSAQGDSAAVAAVECEYRLLPQGVNKINALMDLLLAGPESTQLASPFPQSGVRLLSWERKDGQLHLDFSEQYGELSGVDLTVADYCLALTFCQLTGVESVYVTVEGRELPFRHTQQLRADDVILSGAEEESVYVGVNLWYPREDGALGVEWRQVLKTEDNTLLEAVLTAWLAGPELEGLRNDIPEGSALLSVGLEDGVCVVDLSAPFQEGAPGDVARARLLLYALVNTAGSLETVQSVQLQIEGEPILVYGGVAAGRPLVPRPDLEHGATESQ